MLLEVENLKVEFNTDDGIVRAVDGVSFSIDQGETLGIVGESGSGKSVTNLAIMGLIPQPPGKITDGRALFRGEDMLGASERRLRSIRGNRIAMIFQDPMTSLNPFLTIETQMTEITRLHLGMPKAEARRHAIEMLDRVGIREPDRRIDNYPHEMSGGMRQRVMIAMALSCKPDLLIADEPTTALDVTIQAQIIELTKELQQEEGTAIIMITHDLGVVANMCPNIAVMYAGRFIEEATADNLFQWPRHPYTLGLLNSIPRLDEEQGAELTPIEGQPPNLARLDGGCAFHPRCKRATEECLANWPPLTETEGRRFACIHPITERFRFDDK